MFSANVRKQIPIIILLTIILYIMKPAFVFKPNGKAREYGFGYDSEGYKKTLYTFPIVIMFVAMFVAVAILEEKVVNVLPE